MSFAAKVCFFLISMRRGDSATSRFIPSMVIFPARTCSRAVCHSASVGVLTSLKNFLAPARKAKKSLASEAMSKRTFRSVFRN